MKYNKTQTIILEMLEKHEGVVFHPNLERRFFTQAENLVYAGILTSEKGHPLNRAKIFRLR
jgi:spore cortex formation protein SpoVR/YcgB (stage V sporulation)